MVGTYTVRINGHIHIRCFNKTEVSRCIARCLHFRFPLSIASVDAILEGTLRTISGFVVAVVPRVDIVARSVCEAHGTLRERVGTPNVFDVVPVFAPVDPTVQGFSEGGREIQEPSAKRPCVAVHAEARFAEEADLFTPVVRCSGEAASASDDDAAEAVASSVTSFKFGATGTPADVVDVRRTPIVVCCITDAPHLHWTQGQHIPFPNCTALKKFLNKTVRSEVMADVMGLTSGEVGASSLRTAIDNGGTLFGKTFYIRLAEPIVCALPQSTRDSFVFDPRFVDLLPDNALGSFFNAQGYPWSAERSASFDLRVAPGVFLPFGARVRTANGPGPYDFASDLHIRDLLAKKFKTSDDQFYDMTFFRILFLRV